MSRNVLYMIIGVLVVVAAVAAYITYQERSEPDGVEINVNEDGVSIQSD